MKPFEHPNYEFLMSAQGWVSTAQFALENPNAQALMHRGLLTDHLRKLAKTEFSMRCLFQAFLTEHDTHRRDVVLMVDAEPVVIASTLIPQKLLLDCPSLRTLGDRPIGEHLEREYSAQRSEYEFQCIDLNSKLNKNFSSTSHSNWARRYRYCMPKHSLAELQIVEVLSGSLIN